MADKKERVGIVGAGRMGLSMLKHLIKKGYAVTVCDISEKQREAARCQGRERAGLGEIDRKDFGLMELEPRQYGVLRTYRKWRQHPPTYRSLIAARNRVVERAAAARIFTGADAKAAMAQPAPRGRR